MHKRIPITLDEGYKAMAQNEEREAEVLEWCNGLSSRVIPTAVAEHLRPWLEEYSLGNLWTSGEIGGNRW